MDSEDFKIVSKKNQSDKSQSIRKMWEVMAQRPSDFDMQVIDALKATITTSCNSTGNSTGNGTSSFMPPGPAANDTANDGSVCLEMATNVTAGYHDGPVHLIRCLMFG